MLNASVARTFSTRTTQVTFHLNHIFTGSIARSASRRYLIHSDADFEVFRPAGRHVAPMGVTSSVPHFTPSV